MTSKVQQGFDVKKPNRDLLSRNLGIVGLVRRNDKYSYISIFAPISLELLLHCSL